MRTSNIRCAALVVAAALSLNVSAQKNVLKAFEKFKTSKGVTITNSTHEQGQENESRAQSWRCNVTEFKVWKGSGITFKMKALQEAFEKDSKDPDVTYYGQMKGLDEDATEEEKAKYKKTMVRYNSTDAPVVIGSNTAYNVLVLRSKSKQPNYRVVVAVEWRLDEQYGCVGTLYEIEGRNNLMRASIVSAADEEKGGDDIVTRMTFYRESYTYQDNADNTALLLNMLDYLTAHAAETTENERALAFAVIKDMGSNSPVIMHKGILEQCWKVLEGNEAHNEVIARLEEYRGEFKKEPYYPEKDKVLRRMAEYLRKQTLDAATFSAVRKLLADWREDCTYVPHREYLSRVQAELDRKYDGVE